MSLDALLDEQLAALDIPTMSRFEMYAYLNLVSVMEPHTENVLQAQALVDLIEDEFDSPHSRPWFVSYHGSQFPGEPTNACKRQLAYRMMNFPSPTPMPPWVTATGVVGKAGELYIANAWFKQGHMLAIPEDPAHPEYHQLGFVHEEAWMTVSTDLPILPPGWTKPYIVELKCKAHDVVEEMLQGKLIQKFDGTLEKVGRGPDEKHAIQLKATIGKAHDYDWGEVTVCGNCWKIFYADIFERLGAPDRMNPAISPQRAAEDHLQFCPWCSIETFDTRTFKLDPPVSGEIYYWSRSWPRTTKSFYYEHDQAFMDAGLEILKETRAHYIADEIPPRPDHFQWSIGPCGMCDAKKYCKEDFGLQGKQRKPRPENVRTKLTESAGVEHTRRMRPHYDPDAVRQRVFDEWDYRPGQDSVENQADG